MARFLWICLGGAAGTAARYFLSGWLARKFPAFPFGTLAVNVIGSFLLCTIMQIALSTESFSPTLRLALTTGLMGGFTTYSSFNYETLRFLQEGTWRTGCLNLGVTVSACLVSGALGVFAGRLVIGR
jgi:CrcB protein